MPPCRLGCLVISCVLLATAALGARMVPHPALAASTSCPRGNVSSPRTDGAVPSSEPGTPVTPLHVPLAPPPAARLSLLISPAP
jgi:hypothetical protein